MRRCLLAAVSACLLCGCLNSISLAADSPEPMDWNRARELYRKSQQGGQMSPEDQAYLVGTARPSAGPMLTSNLSINAPVGDTVICTHDIEFSSGSNLGTPVGSGLSVRLNCLTFFRI